MSQITTHVLDSSRGLPAAGVPISLFKKAADGWEKLSSGHTDNGGRLSDLLADNVILSAGVYRLHFDTKFYFNTNNDKGFYPYVDIVFELDASGAHYHVPLLLSTHSYTTYRGS